MISDEAVQAAAKAIRGSVQSTQAAIIGPYAASEMQARAALEAAAPYMVPSASFMEEARLALESSEHLIHSDSDVRLEAVQAFIAQFDRETEWLVVDAEKGAAAYEALSRIREVLSTPNPYRSQA